MHAIIAALVARHGLSRAEVLEEIEAAFSEALSRWYRLEVLVYVREDLRLEAVAYNRVSGVTMQKLVDLPALMHGASVTKALEQHLAMAAVRKLVRRYKICEKNLLWGEVMKPRPGQDMHVATEILPGEWITAVCPVNRIGLHERDSDRFRPGRRCAFHLRRVEPVMVNGTPRTKVILDRVSKTLTETLLRYHLGEAAHRYPFRCLKRYVGHKSIVLSTRKLPREAIIAVDRELRERVQVRIVRQL